MFELITSAVSGIIFGVMVGLLPGLPAYIAPLILMPFASDLSIESILIFWLATHIGSQYFGSVATILLKIPGEVSAMIYLRDITKFDIGQRLDLIRQTALGSSLGSICALTLLVVLYYSGLGTWLVALSTTAAKFVLLLVLGMVLIAAAQRRLAAAVLLIAGVLMAEKTSFDLPTWLYTMGDYTGNVTIFAVILGLLIIPEFIDELRRQDWHSVSIQGRSHQQPLDTNAMWRGSGVGTLIGLFPGPNHIMASVAAYHSTPGSSSKIIAAESANNSAIISSLLPFFFLGLPITVSEFMLYDIMQVKSLVMPNAMFEAWAIWPTMNRLELVFAAALICIIVYTVLAQRFLAVYAWLVCLIYQRMWFLFVGLIVVLAGMDIIYQYVVIWKYLLGLSVLTVIGLWLHRHRIDPLPAIFGFVLGDLLTWAGSQFVALYF